MGRRRPAIVVVEPARARAIRGPREDGRWYWRAEVYSRSESRTVWTGWATRDEVIGRLHEVDTSRARAETQAHTLADLLDYWWGQVKDRADLAWRSQKITRSACRALVQVGGDVRLDRLCRADTDAIAGTLRRRYAGHTSELYLRTLRAALAWGYSVGLSPRPAPEIPAVRRIVPVRDRHTPLPADVAEAVERIPQGWARLAVLMLWATGARIGEIATLRPEDVDLRSGVIRVAEKTGPREIPISDALRRELAAWTPGRRTWLGVSSETARHEVGEALRLACDAAEVRRFTPHALRRLAVDTLARSGVDIATAASLLGHSPAVMLQHYRQVSPDDRRRAIAMARLGEAPSGKAIPYRARAGGRPHRSPAQPAEDGGEPEIPPIPCSSPGRRPK